MYLDSFGLRDKPFTLTHNLTFYYPAIHGEVTDDLCYSIEERQGLAILIGKPGTGKSTLLKNLAASFGPEIRGLLLPDVAFSGASVLRELCRQLAVPVPEEGSLTQVLQAYLQELVSPRHSIVVLVDEAQALSEQQFQQVRFLTNLELDNRKLLHVILAGQPTLDSILASPELEALRQRVTVRTSIRPLNRSETAAYVRFRLKAAGASDVEVFTTAALDQIHKLSHGIPRWINVICDRALLVAYADDSRVVDEPMVDTAASELRVDQWNEQDTGSPSFSAAPKTSTLDSRLDSIEQKLNVILECLKRAGFVDALDNVMHESIKTSDLEPKNAEDNTKERVSHGAHRPRGSSGLS